MRRTIIIAIAALTGLATAGVLAVSGGAQEQGGRTLSYITKNCQFKFVDNPPRSSAKKGDPLPSAGDQFAISCLATDPAGASVGRLDAACTETKGGKLDVAVCQAVYKLADGNLYLATRLPEKDTNTTAGAVVGGDGAYAGARGTFESVDRPGEKGGDPSDDTVHLLP